MAKLFENLSIVIEDGIGPMLAIYMDWLLHDGLFFGLGIIVLPLLARIIHIFKKIF